MPAKKAVTLERIFNKLETIGAHLTRHDRQFEIIKKHLSKHDRQFDIVTQHLSKHDRQFDIVTQHLSKHDRQFDIVTQHFSKHDRQFEIVAKHIFRLEDSIKAAIRTLTIRIRNLEGIVEKLTGDVELLRQEYFAVVQGMKRIEKMLLVHTESDAALRADLTALDARLTKVEMRVNQAQGQ